MEELNTVNEVQEAVVEPQTPEGATNEVTEPAEGTPKAEEGGAVVQPPQTPAENHRQAEMRRSRENDLLQQLRAAEAKNQQSSQQYDRLMEALKGFGYDGDPEAMADAILAQQKGITVEQVQAQKVLEQQRVKEMLQKDPEYIQAKNAAAEYERILHQQIFERDLAEIQKAFPEAKVKSLEELGDDFRNLRAAGVGNLAAFAAVQGAKTAVQQPAPPVMGAVGTTPAEKDFYTSKEVDEITKNHPEMLDDPKVWNTIRRSMTKWGGKNERNDK